MWRHLVKPTVGDEARRATRRRRAAADQPLRRNAQQRHPSHQSEEQQPQPSRQQSSSCCRAWPLVHRGDLIVACVPLCLGLLEERAALGLVVGLVVGSQDW